MIRPLASLSILIESKKKSDLLRRKIDFFNSIKNNASRRQNQYGSQESGTNFLTIKKFRNFLNKMKGYSVSMINNLFLTTAKIFEKEFKMFFRSKSNIFTKFHNDLEKKLKIKMAQMFSSKNLIFKILEVPEGSIHDKSLSAFLTEVDNRELLSQNFSSMLSMDRLKNPESLSLILEYSHSDLEDLNQEFDPFDDGMNAFYPIFY